MLNNSSAKYDLDLNARLKPSTDFSKPGGWSILRIFINIISFVVAIISIILYFCPTVRKSLFNACERCYRGLPQLVEGINCARGTSTNSYVHYSAPLVSRFNSSSLSVSFNSLSEGGEGHGGGGGRRRTTGDERGLDTAGEPKPIAPPQDNESIPENEGDRQSRGSDAETGVGGEARDLQRQLTSEN